MHIPIDSSTISPIGIITLTIHLVQLAASHIFKVQRLAEDETEEIVQASGKLLVVVGCSERFQDLVKGMIRRERLVGEGKVFSICHGLFLNGPDEVVVENGDDDLQEEPTADDVKGDEKYHQRRPRVDAFVASVARGVIAHHWPV